MPPQCIVYLVGAGPGDLGLFTLRGVELLKRAEVVIYDGLVNRDLLRFASPSAELIYGGKHDRTRCVSQEELNALLLAKAREGKCVVRLKGGDPYLFGRGGEEAEILANAGIPFEVVPGVSSIQSVPNYAGIPLTHRGHNSSLTIVTGHQDPETSRQLDWARLAQVPGTLVVMMGLKNIRSIASALIENGKDNNTPVAVISRGSTPRQRTITGTLGTIADLAEKRQLPPPAIIVIGEVVNLRSTLNWFERRPLFGQRIVVTQRADLAAKQVALLRECGAEVLEVPVTNWVPHPDSASFDKALSSLAGYDWVLFSNQHVVDFFFKRFLELFGDLRSLGGIRLGAYGPMTGEKLREWHVKPAAIAADHKTPLILSAISQLGPVKGQRFLVLRGEGATERVPEALEQLGASVDVVQGYEVVPNRDHLTGAAAEMTKNGADWVIFASALAIEHFHGRFDLIKLSKQNPNMRFAIASESIRGSLEELGLKASVISKPNDPEDLIAGVCKAR